MRRIWVLGASDPEMECIESILRQCREEIIYATGEDGKRVHPGNAYRCPVPEVPKDSTVYAVECIGELPEGWVRIDHHRPGDPGYGRPPSEFMRASSIGQVIAELARLVPLYGWQTINGPSWEPRTYELTTVRDRRVWRSDPGVYVTGGEWDWAVSFAVGCWYIIPKHFILAAAADHCLAAAYQGECPGVDPETLMQWRAETRAAFQGRKVEDLLADVELAQKALSDAPYLALIKCDDASGRPYIGEALIGRKCTRPGMPGWWYNEELIADFREAYTVSTVLVAPFAEGATVDSAGVGDSREVVFGKRDEGAWDEGGHHTFVRRGVPELPEAASREGVAYLATVTDRDGREKVILGGCTTPEMVQMFMAEWAPAQGLVDIYGDPARGFAGGYLPNDKD